MGIQHSLVVPDYRRARQTIRFNVKKSYPLQQDKVLRFHVQMGNQYDLRVNGCIMVIGLKFGLFSKKKRVLGFFCHGGVGKWMQRERFSEES
jgi:hypothetical protein